MKKGKTTKLNGFKNFKVLYGTVDSFELKSLYLNLQTWVEPKIDSENWNRIVLNLSRGIKHSIYNNVNKKIFKRDVIVDLDLRHSGITLGKKSFLNLEINFFLNENIIDFKSNILKDEIKEITKKIIFENFSNNKFFYISLTKNPKNIDTNE
jgi:hypothetical protein